jgi:hypothetical protein
VTFAERAAEDREAIIAAWKDQMTPEQLAVLLAGYDRRIAEAQSWE